MTIIFLFLTLISTYANELTVQLESGAVWQHQNDVKITPQSGTQVDFDHFNQGPFFHYRLDLIYQFSKKHSFRAVYAPFNISVSDRISKSINFNNTVFNSGDELTINYMFNSYRLGYLYKIYDSTNTTVNVGFTLKLRDAKIEFSQTSIQSEYDNQGFVPLLYSSLEHKLSNNWFIYSDIDFAAAPQGRAIDLTIKARRQISKNSQFGIGFRSLEGGADNDKVYTFSWLNYFVLDYIIKL